MNFAYQDAGFSGGTTPSQVATFTRFANLVEQNFSDEVVLAKVKAELLALPDGEMADSDRRSLVGRCDYYLWDLNRDWRDKHNFVAVGDASEEPPE